MVASKARRSTATRSRGTLGVVTTAREIAASEKGKAVYFGICSGCHAYNVRLVGPPTQSIQAIYPANPQGIADFIAKPTKKRPDYPEMPPQAYLDAPTRQAVAEFMLAVTK